MKSCNAACLLASMAATSMLATAEHMLPPGWKSCNTSEPGLDDCLKSAIQKAVKDLKNGNAYLGVSSLDPLKFRQFHLNRGGNNGPLNLDITFIDVDLSGPSRVILDSVEADFANGRLTMHLTFPGIALASKYKVRGRVLLMPLGGDGRTNIKMEDVKASLSIQGHKRKKGRKYYFNVDVVEFDFIPKKSSFTFVNPARAHQVEVLSRVVTENHKSIMLEMRPSISAAIAKRLKEYILPVFDIPYDVLFPN